MATKRQLQNTIKDLKEAISSSATPKVFIPKMQQELEAAEKELKELENAQKKEEPKKQKVVKKKIEKTIKKSKAIIKKAEEQPAKAAKPAKAKKSPTSNRVKVSFAQAIKNRKAQGITSRKSDVKRDSKRPALPKGKRISRQTGKAYWEYRENRIDRRQPPIKEPKLEKGGYMAQGGIIEHGLKIGDKIIAVDKTGNKILVDDISRQYHVVDLSNGERTEGRGSFADGGVLTPMIGGVDADPRFDILSPQFAQGGELHGSEPHREEMMKRGGSLASYKYLSNRDIESITTWDGVTIDGDKVLDGVYIKKSVKL